MIRLSKRLEEIASECAGCDLLLDIGCDHALIPVSLLEKESIRFAIASDINSGPLEAAKKNAGEAGVGERMRFVISDGLKNIDLLDPGFPPDKTTLLISGMGGPLTERILKEGKEKIESIGNFVFSPQSKIADFRRFLGRNGFFIKNEKLAQDDGKYYFLISCKKGEDACKDDLEYELGPDFFDEKSVEKEAYLNLRLRTFRDLSHNKDIKGESRRGIEEKLSLYEKAVKKYETM